MMRKILMVVLVAFFAGCVCTAQAAGAETRVADLETAFASGQDLSALWQNLSPAERETALERARFDALHDGAADYLSQIQMLNQTRTPGALNSNNMLGIPLRVGTLELKALFKKMRGAIVVCTPTRFEATLDTYRMVVIPHPTDPKKVLSSFSGNDPQVPQQPIGAVITTNGTSAKIVGDDGTIVEVTHTGNGTYKFNSNKLPISVSAKYID